MSNIRKYPCGGCCLCRNATQRLNWLGEQNLKFMYLTIIIIKNSVVVVSCSQVFLFLLRDKN